jgi:hypothetical protein
MKCIQNGKIESAVRSGKGKNETVEIKRKL